MAVLSRLTAPDDVDAWAAYQAARAREARRLDVAELRALPRIDARHPHAHAWRLRARSAAWLVSRLRMLRARHVLDLGCGNGWLAARLARESSANVCAVDIDPAELGLAAAAFGDTPRLSFHQADVFAPGFDALVPARRFDAVVIAGVAPYFPDLRRLFGHLFARLAERGEVLLVDSPFWPEDELAAARARTERHFARLGVPAAAAYFTHHGLAELAEFTPRFHYRPQAWSARLARVLLRQPWSPFPWISVPRPAYLDR